MSATSSRPIGVFDSGIGGLTVARELITRLPNESILYFGDTARVPYGPKSAANVRRYSREAAAFFLSREIKLMVIACNTATAHAAEVLQSELEIPVIGVVEPGARAAVAATRTGRIGVIGTSGTIASGVYDLAVRRRLDDARVYAQPCPLFVPLVEEGMIDHPATRLIAREYLAPLHEVDIDVLILGCTHYPLLRPVLERVMGSGTSIVDSAEETARDVVDLLEGSGLRRLDDSPPQRAFFVSDVPHRFREVGRRFLGSLIERVEQVDVSGYLASVG